MIDIKHNEDKINNREKHLYKQKIGDKKARGVETKKERKLFGKKRKSKDKNTSKNKVADTRYQKNIKSKQNNIKDVKKKKTRPILNPAWVITIVIFFVTVSMLFVVMYRYSQIADMRYDINNTNLEIQEINKEIKVQKTKIDESIRSDVIGKKATEKLGMQYREAEQIQYVTVD